MFNLYLFIILEKYIHSVNEESIVKHLRSLYYKTKMASKVLSFKDEDDLYERIDLPEVSKPVFVKFYIDTCTHCKALKQPFIRFAELFRNQIQFMEIDCNLNEENKLFCSKHSASSYPTLILFTVNERINFSGEDRSLISLEKFFSNHISNFKPALFESENSEVSSKAPKLEANINVAANVNRDTEVNQPVKKSVKKQKKDNRDEL